MDTDDGDDLPADGDRFSLAKVRHLAPFNEDKLVDKTYGDGVNVACCRARRYKLDDEIKKMVRFKIQDITKPIDQRFFDVIFCRNVFIYFTKEAKATIIGNFHKALNDGGYLIIGKTETMPNARRGGFKTIDVRTRLFQKVSGANHP